MANSAKLLFNWKTEKSKVNFFWTSEEMLYILYIIIIVFFVIVVMFKNRQVIVTSLGYCWYSGGSPQGPNCWSSCNVWRKMGAGGDGGW